MAEMVKATLNGEFEIILPKHRADRPEWYTEKGWEKNRLRALRDEIKRQLAEGMLPVVYYVGAEEGEMAALCQMWGAEVVLFEPNPKVWPNIKAIWEANNLEPPMACFEGFASNINSPHQMIINDALHVSSWPAHADEEVVGNHGFKELYLEGNSYPQVTIASLWSLLLQTLPRTVDVRPTIITFDCEGSDWQVMRGAEEILSNYKPTIFASIHPEFMFHQWGEYSRDFRNWIIAYGYKEEILDYEHELHCIYTPVEISHD